MKEVQEITDEALKNELRKLGIQLRDLPIGKTIDLTQADGKIIRLQKKDEKGWVCLTNQVKEFNEYIDKDHYVMENGNKSYISYVSNENLWKFLQIPENEEPTPEITPEPTPEPIEETEEGL